MSIFTFLFSVSEASSSIWVVGVPDVTWVGARRDSWPNEEGKCENDGFLPNFCDFFKKHFQNSWREFKGGILARFA